MAFKMPFSAAVNFKSHSDTGNTKEIPHVSIKTAFKIKPLRKITIKLKIPNSAKNELANVSSKYFLPFDFEYF